MIALLLGTVIPTFLIQETSGSLDRDKILTQPVENVQHGYVVLPSRPGWGVDLNDDFLRAHPYQECNMIPRQVAEDGAIVDR